MTPLISKSRSKRSKQRARAGAAEGRGHRLRHWPGLLTAAGLWLAVMLLLYGGREVKYSGLALGQRAPATVIAAVSFECEDIGRTELNRREAADSVAPVFIINQRPLRSAVRALDKLFDRVMRLREGDAVSQAPAGFAAALGDTLDLLEVALTPKEVAQLAPAGQEEQVLATIKGELITVWNRGIVSPDEKRTAFQGAALGGDILIKQSDEQLTKPLAVQALLTPEQALHTTISQVQQEVASGPTLRTALEKLLGTWIVPNLLYDKGTTDALREQARRAVQPVGMTVREGAVLVERGGIVTPQIIEQLRAHEIKSAHFQSATERRLRIAGSGCTLLVALALSFGLLRVIRPTTPPHPREVLMLALLSLLCLVPVKGLAFISTSTRLLPPGLVEFMTPLALPPLLAAILAGGPAAVAIGLWSSLATAVLLGNSFSIFVLGLTATVIAAVATRQVRKRGQVFRAGLWVGLGEMAYAIGLAALNQPEPGIVALQALAALLSGLFCAGLALLLIPLFELAFSLTTDLTLLEYSDLGNPLLQRLAKEAPGTYHHSLMVADLARAAAAEIGGNELLARVCAYFHDIGKLTKPEFFTENQQFCPNPHDDLEPSMSTLIITAHVKEGYALARQHKLPKPILDSIREHHGTSLVSYFYHRAKQQQENAGAAGADSGRHINEGDFRYEGPRPSSREMGILLLADSIEAASRSMAKPTAARIKALVHEIVDTRVADHQLDECDLTMADLSVIKESFVFTLTSMLHARVEYPQNENRSKQPTAATPGERGEGEKADALAHAERATA